MRAVHNVHLYGFVWICMDLYGWNVHFWCHDVKSPISFAHIIIIIITQITAVIQNKIMTGTVALRLSR